MKDTKNRKRDRNRNGKIKKLEERQESIWKDKQIGREREESRWNEKKHRKRRKIIRICIASTKHALK